MGTPCIPPYCFWMLTKGSQRSFLGASDTSHSLPVHFVKQTRGSNQVNDVLTVPHWLNELQLAKKHKEFSTDWTRSNTHLFVTQFQND